MLKRKIALSIALFALGLIFIPVTLKAQSRFKTADDSVSNALRQEDQHKMAGIEQIVEAMRSFDNLEKDKEYTILAPNNKAFRKLSTQTIDYLVEPSHQNDLNDLLSYHTIIGKFSEKAIRKQIEKSEGKAVFNTLSGIPLQAYIDKEDNVIFVDKSKRKIKLLFGNSGKGLFPIHTVDSVILPFSAVY
jgi:uncharacterized surface protein with fasciclin (FAS1) repeats